MDDYEGNTKTPLPLPGTPLFKELPVIKKIAALEAFEQQLKNDLEKTESNLRGEIHRVKADEGSEVQNLRRTNTELTNEVQRLKDDYATNMEKQRKVNAELQAQVDQHREVINLLQAHVKALEDWMSKMQKQLGDDDQ
eukprot:TRINITY_DN13567_c0_g1::TRINITY_DN13567_c0_g1_i1::g.22203::m.22203 TRINITY_DN13567_c0_g1::TRINITY_DN13567_c0_g1_i1::g.22203  ORF type:complete len:152 (+),score=19.63,DUF1640/PF07798.6/0.076,DUF1640/PF07798.6/6.6,Reo_sigmaC/PF04582.7/0.0082,TPR_MLP1_2/PF07926.7/18,TPR_MLP1_2/PF07926.7/0.06,Baculo_PEP_C/PF04513.7/0.046,Mnd1/PF03962.10/0.028,Phlebovirus_NSM/PF07246.6/0.029,TMF_DNA_bd/PF12329.3/1.4e+02,TMF_DNA_bd/PF12329.3/0.85,TMF_DNA_bd/PF12329.3/0.87,FlxA/PF14282.1/1e+03,FlxA/PF14282.1/0.019,DUF9